MRDGGKLGIVRRESTVGSKEEHIRETRDNYETYWGPVRENEGT